MRPVSASRKRLRVGWFIVLGGLPLATALLLVYPGAGSRGLPTALLVYTAVVLCASSVGGRLPGLVAAFIGFFASNWYFVPPQHTLVVADGENIIALSVFVAVAVTVSALVDRVERRSLDAAQSRREAETLARSSATMLVEADPLPNMLRQLRASFGFTWAAVVRGNELSVVEAEDGERGAHAVERLAITTGRDEHLVVAGRTVSAADRRVLMVFADQFALALDARRSQAAATAAIAIAKTDELRTALLRAVSHDLRTPLASMKSAVSTLRIDDSILSDTDRKDLLAGIEDGTDRLSGIVENLLDFSRLEAGVMPVTIEELDVVEVLDAAADLARRRGTNVTVVAFERPLVASGDIGLLDRVVANIVGNAVVWSPKEIELVAVRRCGAVSIDVVDHGPGIEAGRRDQVFEPFHRAGDRNPGGVGLGLSVARGFVDAMGGMVMMRDTPGGGLTVEIVLNASEP